MSQFVNTNTIPCEISQDQDTSFLNLNDLSNVIVGSYGEMIVHFLIKATNLAHL